MLSLSFRFGIVSMCQRYDFGNTLLFFEILKSFFKIPSILILFPTYLKFDKIDLFENFQSLLRFLKFFKVSTIYKIPMIFQFHKKLTFFKISGHVLNDSVDNAATSSRRHKTFSSSPTLDSSEPSPIFASPERAYPS